MNASSPSADLLIELGTEELPPKALPTLARVFHEELAGGLRGAGLAFTDDRRFAAPRRLAVSIPDLAAVAPEQAFERRGPALKAAFDADGNPTRAATGFAASCGVTVDDLVREETGKGVWLVHRGVQPGRRLEEILPEIVERALAKLPIPKRMRWGDSEHEFVRPVHWLVALHGETVVPLMVMGVAAGRETRGHRFHAPEPIVLEHAGVYRERLESTGFVCPDFDDRRARIRRDVEAQAAQAGAIAVIPEALLDEVAAITEWPVALTGRFDERFLAVPQEALISTMQDNQKYFPLVDSAGRMQPAFVVVANLESRRPQSVIEGNERVLRPRFADAEFFWKRDRCEPLEARVARLDEVVFETRLGTLGSKVARVAALAGRLAPAFDVDPVQAERAARLAKADLVTTMVFEFPELQGTMGRYYAAADGEDAAVADAIEQHYWPRQSGGALPQTPLARVVALADRFDTLVGIFAIGKEPTGAKDPFALRRAAIGVLRILTETGHPLALESTLRMAAEPLAAVVADADAAVLRVAEFLRDRLRGLAQDAGIAAEVFEAVMAVSSDAPTDALARMHALQAFRSRPEAGRLAAANKRTQNILRKAEDFDASAARVDAKGLVDAAERALHAEIERVAPALDAATAAARYDEALEVLAGLADPVDAFFTDVMVMHDDAAIRNNRLALLATLRTRFETVADLSRLATG